MVIQSSSQIIALKPNKYHTLSIVIYQNIVHQLTKYRKKLSEIVINSVLYFNYWMIGLLLRQYFKIDYSIQESVFQVEKTRILIICNHVTRIDPYLVLSVLPFPIYQKFLPIRFFTANMYFKPRIASLILQIQGCFRSHSVVNKISGLKGGLTLSDRGHTLFMFPQGKRIRNPAENANVTIGPAYLAKYRNFTILPVHIEYSSDKKNVSINWGKPFKVEKGMIHEDLQQTSIYIMDEVFKLKKNV